MEALVVAEQEHGELRAITVELIGAAQGIGARITAAVIDPAPETFRDALDGMGADEVIGITVAPDAFPGEVHRDIVTDLIGENSYDVTLVGFTSSGIAYAGCVAATLGLGYASGITGLSLTTGDLTAKRPAFAGKVVNHVNFPDHEQVMVSVRKGAFGPAPAAATRARYTARSFEPGALEVSHTQYISIDGDIDITTADFILSIGRGAGGKENLARFERLAAAMGATLAGSRPLIDSGMLHPAYQVGTSGRSVHPKIYLALGISGAIQHVAGIAGSETVIAVNQDRAAPIFDVADFGAVADLFGIADELEKIYATNPTAPDVVQTS